MLTVIYIFIWKLIQINWRSYHNHNHISQFHPLLSFLTISISFHSFIYAFPIHPLLILSFHIFKISFRKNRGFYEDFHIDTTLYMYAGFSQKIDVWKKFFHPLIIEHALQENTEKTMSSSSKNHFPALYLFWKPSFWCLQIFNFQKPWELPSFSYYFTSFIPTFSIFMHIYSSLTHLFTFNILFLLAFNQFNMFTSI